MIERNFDDWDGRDEEERELREAKEEGAWANAEAAFEKEYEEN